MNQLLQKEIWLRIAEESIPRIVICLEKIEEKDLFFAPNMESNSIGNLILHLNGNVRQWLLGKVLKQNFVRQRDAEFMATEGNIESMKKMLENLKSDIQQQLPKLAQVDLEANLEVQGISGSYFSAIVHVIEHFSYHTGQIALLCKLITNNDLGFYSNHSQLNAQ